MTKYSFRGAQPGELKEKALALIQEWGYPRELTTKEKGDYSLFILIEPDAAVFWIHPLHGSDENFLMHLIVNPKHRSKVTRDEHTLIGFTAILEMIGIKRLYACPVKGSNVVQLVERLGWERDDIGYYLEVRP